MTSTILFLCTGNSCRSQMAEGWANHLLAPSVQAFSAGTKPHELNRLAVRAMNECGVDISGHQPKSLESVQATRFDLMITVCDNAAKSCPRPLAGAKTIHVPFDDPPKLAANAVDDDEAMAHYRRVRDEIKAFVLTLPKMLGESEPPG